MALPTSRNETCTSAGQVKASLLNDLQDQVIALHAYRKATKTLLLGCQAFVGVAGNAVAYSADGSFGQGINMIATIPILVGMEIDEVRAEIKDVAGSTMTIAITRIDDYGTATQIAVSSQSGGGGTEQTLTIPALSEVTVAGKSYVLVVIRNTGAGTDLNLSRVEVDYHEPG